MSVGTVVGQLFIALLTHWESASADSVNQASLGARSASLISSEGRLFKDLNRNGRLDTYEDWRAPAPIRVADLVSKMTLAEKAGVLMHASTPNVSPDLRSDWDFSRLSDLVQKDHVITFISRLAGDPSKLATVANKAQELAEQTRLGIPLTISSDPRNHFQYVAGASVAASAFSTWPETTGLAAIGDPTLVRRFADIARQEYLAVGLRSALSPMADLATEPRWPRTNGTFGEDPVLAKELVQAYVEGFQHGPNGLSVDSVAAVVKHWVGYGASLTGYDSHNPYGKEIGFPGGQFEAHVLPFTGAFAARVSGVMPTYGIPVRLTIDGKPAEPVGASFSSQMINDQLRGRYGFQGVVLTDWMITNDCAKECLEGTLEHDRVGMPWGVEAHSAEERFARALDAGVDQFGGVVRANVIVDLVQSGRIKVERLNQSVNRILLERFLQGAFENPYVDTQVARAVVGNSYFRAEALDAQRRSHVLLKNHGNVLPLAPNKQKVYLYGIAGEVAARFGFVPVSDAKDADFAILRIAAPYESNKKYFFGSRQHEGSLAYAPGNPDYDVLSAIPLSVPIVVSVYLDRPAILSNIQDRAQGLLANFGASDDAFFDVLTGRAKPEGRLPFELPSSMDAVRAQLPDVPHDSAAPLYKIKYGLRY